jgi:ribosomal protein L20
MTPTEIRKATLDQLRSTREDMMSTRWMLKLRAAAQQEKDDHARMLVNVQHAILELENKKLAEIRDQLVANEQAISDGIDALKESLKKIEKIEKTIKAIGQFLQILGRVAKLVATA